MPHLQSTDSSENVTVWLVLIPASCRIVRVKVVLGRTTTSLHDALHRFYSISTEQFLVSNIFCWFVSLCLSSYYYHFLEPSSFLPVLTWIRSSSLKSKLSYHIPESQVQLSPSPLSPMLMCFFYFHCFLNLRWPLLLISFKCPSSFIQ